MSFRGYFILGEALMNDKTQETLVFWLPWVLLGAVLVGVIQWHRMARAKRVQELTRGFAKMGSLKIVELGDAVARADIPAVIKWMESTATEYQGERGALKFTWDVIKMGGDDLLKDAEYEPLFGKWIEEQVMGFIVDDGVQADLVHVADIMKRLHMDDTAMLVDAMSRDKVAPVKAALQHLIGRFRDASKVESELVSWLQKALPELAKNPEEKTKLLAALNVTLTP